MTQGKRHQQNLAKRAAREAAEKPALPQPNRRATTKKTVKIGRPGYKVTKQYDPETMQRSLLFQVQMQSCLEYAFHFFAFTDSGIHVGDIECFVLGIFSPTL